MKARWQGKHATGSHKLKITGDLHTTAEFVEEDGIEGNSEGRKWKAIDVQCSALANWSSRTM